MTCTLLALAATLALSSDFAQLRKSWGLQPADPSRPGLWKTRGGSSPAILVRADTTSSGEVLRTEWSAENGLREVDIPEERFWAILDGFAKGQEWIETDPDALPATPFTPPSSQLAQGFRCPSCRPPLVAATWSPHGGTRLLVGRVKAPRKAPRLSVSESVTEDGLLSLASQQGLSLASKNPCREGVGSCTLELDGPKSEHWRFARTDAASPWKLAEASFVSNAWWNPEWDWDSLRIAAPREFRLVLENWLNAELDVDGARLLRPLEPILLLSVAEWNSRTLPGLSVGTIVDRLVTMPSAPSAIVLCETSDFTISIDTFGRRKLELREAPR